MRFSWAAGVFGLLLGLGSRAAAAEFRGEVIHGANCEAFPAVGGANSQGLWVHGPPEVTCGLTMGNHSFTGGSMRWDAPDLKVVFLQVGGSGRLRARLLFQEFLSGVNHWGPEEIATGGAASLTLLPPSAIPSGAWHVSVVILVDTGAHFLIRDVNPLWWH